MQLPLFDGHICGWRDSHNVLAGARRQYAEKCLLTSIRRCRHAHTGSTLSEFPAWPCILLDAFLVGLPCGKNTYQVLVVEDLS